MVLFLVQKLIIELNLNSFQFGWFGELWIANWKSWLFAYSRKEFHKMVYENWIIILPVWEMRLNLCQTEWPLTFIFSPGESTPVFTWNCHKCCEQVYTLYMLRTLLKIGNIVERLVGCSNWIWFLAPKWKPTQIIAVHLIVYIFVYLFHWRVLFTQEKNYILLMSSLLSLLFPCWLWQWNSLSKDDNCELRDRR